MFDWSLFGLGTYYVLPLNLGLLNLFGFAYTPRSTTTIWLGVFALVVTFSVLAIAFPWNWVAANSQRPSADLSIRKVPVVVTWVIVAAAATWSASSVLTTGSTEGPVTADAVRSGLSSLGPFVIFLQVPLGLFVHYWCRRWQRLRPSRVLALSAVAAAAALTAVARGQRTDLLLLFLLPLIAFSRRRERLWPLFAGAVGAVGFAGWYGMQYKRQYAQESGAIGSLQQLLSGDLDRNWTLWAAIEESPLIGTVILPKAGDGFIYTAGALLPRSFVPFKGYSSETWFTFFFAPRLGIDPGAPGPAEINWGFVFGATVDGIVNFGLVGVLIAAIAHALVLRRLQSLCGRSPAVYSVCAVMSFQLVGHSFANLILVIFPVLVVLLVLGRPVTVLGSTGQPSAHFEVSTHRRPDHSR